MGRSKNFRVAHQNKEVPNPVDSASIISRLFFWWLIPILKTGYRRHLETIDLYKAPSGDVSSELGQRLEEAWETEIAKAKESKGRPKLIRVLLRIFGARLIYIIVITILPEAIFLILEAVVLMGLMRTFQAETLDYSKMYLQAGGLCTVVFLYAVGIHAVAFEQWHFGLKLLIGCSSLVYRKAVKLWIGALGPTTAAQVLSLLSRDINIFPTALFCIPYPITVLSHTIMAMYILWDELGMASLVTIAGITLYVALQGRLAGIFSDLRHKLSDRAVKRIRIMEEILNSMRVIKLYAWEKPFIALLSDARRQEVSTMKKRAVYQSLNVGISQSFSKLALLLIFLFYFMYSDQLTPEKAFIGLVLCNQISRLLALVGVQTVSHGSEAWASVRKIEDFLLLEEIRPTVESLPSPPSGDSPVVLLKNVKARWRSDSQDNVLSDVSFNAHPGQLIVVVGAVGSGKTSLLHAILGELPLSSGRVAVAGKVAFVSQEAWLVSASIRHNILLGRPWDPEKYQKVLAACALITDLMLLPQGDNTQVGERGMQLSGGQRARVSLARALYDDCDVYLMDDPMSAVDSRVSRHLFDHCINGYLHSKVRILVTQQQQYLKAADLIIFLENGKISAQGTYDMHLKNGRNFHVIKISSSDEDSVKSLKENAIQRGGDFQASVAQLEHIMQEATEIKDEETKRGKVSLKVHYRYFKEGGGLYGLFAVIALCVITRLCYSSSDYWLQFWTDAVAESRNSSAVNGSSNHLTSTSDMYLYGYIGLVLGFCITMTLFSVSFFLLCTRASINLHNSMFTHIMAAPMSFFDSTPVGQILNRFSKDLGEMDDCLPGTFQEALTLGLGVVYIALVVVSVNLWLLIPTVVMSVGFFALRRFFLKSAVEIQRLSRISRSPMFSHLCSTLKGLSTVRSRKSQEAFIKDFDDFQDVFTSAYYLYLAAARWFALWLELCCGIYVTIVISSLVAAPKDYDAGQIGLVIASALNIMDAFQWWVRQTAEVENQMVAVERVLEYTQLEAEEKPRSTPGEKPPKDWPQYGTIGFDNVSLKYGDGPVVLKGITCCVKAAEKVGIVGRTGAGKSSMVAALFRLTESDGSIIIDGYRVQDMELHCLRPKLSLIPQEPVFFSGSVRRNLDPMDQYEDHQLWGVLEQTRLKDAVAGLPDGLSTEVTERGGNFSVGQRQLICLARALLRKNRILVLDEATANVDSKTDSIIQQTLRDNFADCTVLTIAHRLHTIMDCDRVLVLEEGRLKEFDAPHVLLLNGSGYFSKMVDETGPIASGQLRKMAKNAYVRRRRHPSGESG